MIGRWLSLLSPEQEDRVLLNPIRPGGYGEGCLVATAANFASDAPTKTMQAMLGRAIKGTIPEHWNEDVGTSNRKIEFEFDNLCKRFGATRVIAAVRSRILRNRLRRELAGVREAVLA